MQIKRVHFVLQTTNECELDVKKDRLILQELESKHD